VTVFFEWEGNRISDIAMTMRHRLCSTGTSTSNSMAKWLKKHR